MSGEDEVNGNGRVSNYQMLRDVQTEQKEQGKLLASLAASMEAWVALGQQQQQQLTGMGSRIEAADREAIALRARIENLEARPIAMGPEAQGVLRSQVTTNQTDIATVRENYHSLNNKLQPLMFTKEECADIRTYLRIAKRRRLEDVLTEEQRVDLVKVRDWATPEKQKAIDATVANLGASGRRWFRRMEIGVGLAIIVGAAFTAADLFLRLHGT